MVSSLNDKTPQRLSIIYGFLHTLSLPPVTFLGCSISAYKSRRHKQANSQLVHYATESKSDDASTNDTQLVKALFTQGTDSGKKYAVQGSFYPTRSLMPYMIFTGSHLLIAALAESDMRDPQNQAFSRQLYVNSMTYLLQGLPSDLSDQEIHYLQSSFPEQLNTTRCIGDASCDHRAPSMLHRSIASLILSLCLLIKLILPYIKQVLAVAYSYERTHHVTERALVSSMATIDSVSNKSSSLAGSAIENKAVTGAFMYCVEGICGGLNEGLGEGLKAMEARKSM